MVKKIIQAINITKYYKPGGKPFLALKDISIDICRGDFISIIGASGSGKSTLMNIIGLLDDFDTGKLVIDGKDVSLYTDKEKAIYRGKKIGFIFQSFNLLNKYTVLENVLLPSLYNDITNPRQTAIEILTELGLEDKLKSKPLQLSGGQQQRVAIARALINDPDIILADEPTGNLDSKSGKKIIEILKELNKKGKTIIIITHDPNIAEETKKSIKLFDGQIIND